MEKYTTLQIYYITDFEKSLRKMASYYKYDTAHGQRWQCRFRVVDADGKYKQKTLRGYETKKAAERAYREYMDKLSKEELTPSTEATVTFREAYNAYMMQQSMRAKESTIITMQSRCAIVLDRFADRVVNEIKPEEVLQWQNELMKRYNSTYVIEVRSKFNAIIRFSHKFYNTSDRVAEAVANPKLPEQLKEEMHILTEEQYGKARQFLTEPYLTYFDFLFLSGCRRSEATALQIEDVDFINNKVHIKQSLTRKTNKGSYKLTTTKNAASVRWITLPPIFMSQIKQRLTGANKGFVFSRNGDGLLPIADTSATRAFKNALIKADVPMIRIHDLRHSHASRLISQGVSIVAVSHRLGHSDIRETLNTYSHLLPSDSEKIDNILDNTSFLT